MPAQPLVTYLLRHGDDGLILAQRLSEWAAVAPELETDIALTNLALDILGQSRSLLTYAGQVEGQRRTEDDFAFHRDERQFTNLLLVEQPIGDFAHTMARQLLFDAYRLPLWEGLTSSNDATLAGIAGKAHKEARYHFRHSKTWVIRLGDGTDESHRRMQDAIDTLWRFTGELFVGDEIESELPGIAVDPADLAAPWKGLVEPVLATAGLVQPEDVFAPAQGRQGVHSEYLGHLLAEMQYIPRSFPGLSW